jgi:hypothetical protein
MSNDEDSNDDFSEIRKNLSKRPNSSQLEVEKDFGSVEYKEFTFQYKLEIDLGEEDLELEIKGNHQKFWVSLLEMVKDQITIYDAIKNNYSSNQSTSRGEKLRELDPILNKESKIRDEYKTDLEELADYLEDNYDFKNEEE